jgi:hypothetical protein
MPSEEVCNASPATVTLEPWQRDSGHLAVSAPAWFSDTAPGFYRIRTETRLWANHESRGGCVPALKLRRKREGSRKKCQGFKPDLGDPAVRDYRGASGNVAMHAEKLHAPESGDPVAARRQLAGRGEKAMSHKSLMHGGGESYSGVVPTKEPNKSGRPPAEDPEGAPEGRPLTKENTLESNPSRTPSRVSGTAGPSGT